MVPVFLFWATRTKVEEGDLLISITADLGRIDIRSYRQKVLDYLKAHIDSRAISKIHNLEPINEEDLLELEHILWHELGSQEEYHHATDINNLAFFVRSLT